MDRYVEIAKNMRVRKKENPDYFLYTRFDYTNAKTDADLKKAVLGLLDAPPLPKEMTTKRFNICLKNGDIIGYIGFLYNPKGDPKDPKNPHSDLGIFLDPNCEHKGYAFEAQKVLLADYFINCDDKIYLTIHPKNGPSHHLNEKCGAVKIDYTEESKYGSARDILVITRSKFIETAFKQKFATAEEEKQFLRDYFETYNSPAPNKCRIATSLKSPKEL